MTDITKIDIPITTEGVIELKQACQILIQEYIRYCAGIAENDENAALPLIAKDVVGLKTDIRAGEDSLNSYNKLSIDDIERPKTDFGDLGNYQDINNISGNYSISQSVYDEVQDELSGLFNNMSNKRIGSDEVQVGNKFSSDKKDGEASKYGSVSPVVRPERTNTGGEAETSDTSDWEKRNTGSFKNTILEDCIPCDLRLKGLDDLKPEWGLLNPLEEMAKRYKKLVEDLKNLLTNTEIADDLCNLLNFLDFQCVPDLYSIIALLGVLMRKLMDLMPNLDGAFMQFLGPFFSPLLSGLSELLDKYIQLIMRPVDCVLNSLDTQLSKLDVQRAFDKQEIHQINYHRKKERHYRYQIEQLKERKDYLESLKGSDYSGGDTPPVKVGGQTRATQSNFLRDIIESNPESSRAKQFEGKPPSALTRSIDSEIEVLDKEISTLDTKHKKAEEKVLGLVKGQASQDDPSNASVARKVLGAPGKAKEGLRGFRNSFGSSLYELRNQILNVKKIMNDTLAITRDEIQRIIMGRAATSEDMMEAARNIQRISRIIGIVRVVQKLAKTGKMCDNNNNDPSAALGSFLSAARGTNKNENYYNVYSGTIDGDSTLLIAPSDAVLELEDAEGVRNIDDLSEIRKLNKDGLVKDLGDISATKVTAVSPDLGTRKPATIVEFDLCKNSNFSTQPTANAIKGWATDAGLN